MAGTANLTNAGKGRPKGVPNKATATMKAAIESVYQALQAKSGKPHGHFLEWAEDNETEFYKLAAKLIPVQIGGDPGGAPLSVALDLSGLNDGQKRALASIRLPGEG